MTKIESLRYSKEASELQIDGNSHRIQYFFGGDMKLLFVGLKQQTAHITV